MPLSESAEPFAWMFSTIQGSAFARASTAEMWEAIRGFAEDNNYVLGPGAWAAVNEMRSIAAGQRNGMEWFARATDEELLDPNRLGSSINARDPSVANLLPEYVATFNMSFTDPDTGVQIPITRTMRDTWAPGMTVGDVRQAVSEAAEGLLGTESIPAALRDGGYVGVSAINPVAI